MFATTHRRSPVESTFRHYIGDRFTSNQRSHHTFRPGHLPFRPRITATTTPICELCRSLVRASGRFANLSLTQEHALTELRNEFRALYETEVEDEERLIAALNKVQKYINRLRYINELRQSVEYLIYGTLPPQLVSKLSLRTTLLGIKAHLRRYYSNSHLIFESATDFYAKSHFHFGRHDKYLLIHLYIPVTTFGHKFKIFKVTTFPVFVAGRTSHATTVLNLPRYFVTSQHGTHFSP